jgi:hypothetical protein
MLAGAHEAHMTITERLRREGRKEGHRESRKEQHRQALRELLGRRFGPLPEAAVDRIEGAGLEQLGRWFDRSITARSLRAVFTDEP